VLNRLVVNGFRCLKQVDLRFSPLTVLVGPNASGKSAVLEFLDPERPIHERDRWNRKRDKQVMVRMEYPGEEPRQREIQVGQSHHKAAQYQYQLLHLDLQAIRQPNEVEPERRLAGNGGNLTNVFDTLSRGDQVDIAKTLSELVGVISDVEARPVDVGRNTLIFQDRWDKAVYHFPHEVSDGTMLLLAFLVCRYQTPAPTLLAIEEPERGLHPYLLGELVGILRKLTRGEMGGPPVQVIVATHSAELLDHLEPGEVRFMSRDPSDGNVLIEEAPVGTAEWQRAIEEYRNSMGGIWLSGGLGGVPGR